MKYALSLFTVFTVPTMILVAASTGNGVLLIVTSLLGGVIVSMALCNTDREAKP